MSIPRRDAGPAAARALACQANPLHAGAPARVSRLAIGAALLAGTAACTASPQYPIYAGERPGDGSIMVQQPAYPISARDAQQNAADRASQNGYPAYGAAPVGGPQAPVYAPPPPGAASPPDDAADDAPRGLQSAPVDSSDLPPPAAAPSDAPPPPPPPQAEAIGYGGGQLVFGTDSVARPGLVFATEDGAPPRLDLIAYRHRRHAAATPAAEDEATAKADPKPTSRSRHRRGAKAEDGASAAPAADTPYQTVVKPGEKLSDVAERVHSSREALAELNDVKHPRRVKPGTVLKVPYRYTYEVQKGDTLYTISHRFNQDPEAMAKLNGLKAVPTLQPGETIQLPPTAEDTGKRDHATAAGPSPVAAPEKLADAALAKETRHGRRRRAEATEGASEQAATQPAGPGTPEAAPEPAKLSRAERRRLLREQKATAQAAAGPDASLTTPAAEPPPARLSRAERRRLLREQKAAAQAAATPETGPTAEAPPVRLSRAERRRQRREEERAARQLAGSVQAAPPPAPIAPAPRTPVVAQAATATSAPPPPYAPDVATLTLPSPYASTSVASAPPRSPSAAAATSPAVAAAGATATQPYYAGTRPYTAPSAATSSPPPTSYRAATRSAPAASTYAMPGYAPRAATASGGATGSSRVATLTTPTYAPGGYPPGGYAPSLGRARPATPTVSGIAGLTPTQITTAGRGRFIWPLRGQVISPFGDKGTGQHNDGVDIAATPGSGVRAAAAGEVVYAGSSIPGFGNLVLVKHSGGWVTAYAHLDRIEVRMRDSVAQGDELGQAGQTGAVDRPQLHFEVRYAPDPTEKARPVDPTLVLPAG